jgi:hypothetical protein
MKGSGYEATRLCCANTEYVAAVFFQTPPDLVVKFQPVDIVDGILWLVLRPRVVYQREIKG